MEELITKEIFDELVQTGQLQLASDEAEDLRGEMNRQMDVIRQLDAIPLDASLRPVIHGNPYPMAIRCDLRDDVPQFFNDPEAILSQAPHSRDGYFISPDVTHQKIG